MLRKILLVVAVTWMMVALAPLRTGIETLLYLHPPRWGAAEPNGFPILREATSTAYGFTLTGERSWIVPLVIGSGGLFGGVSLLIWAWRMPRD